jgi:hypothetical protein
MAPRLDLQEVLKTVLGSSQVYFDGPSTPSMVYPAIVYTLDDIQTEHADNKPYKHAKRYQVIVIDYDPDTDVVDGVMALPTASFSRKYKADNLHHFVINLFF